MAAPKTKEKEQQGKKMFFALAAFTVEATQGEIIQIIRISDHFAWRWDNKKDGKTYGDYVIQPPYQNEKLDKEIKALMDKEATMPEGVKKTRIKGRIAELVKFYDDLKLEDVGNLFSTLIQQADMTIDAINGEEE